MTNHLINTAAIFARNEHGNQLDDNGLNYFDAHVKQVVGIPQQVTRDEEILAAGYLHDILEDTTISLETLTNLFGKRVATLVWEVTHVGEKDNVGYTFPNLHSREAIMIKFADRLSNISRMETWSDKRQVHYLKKSTFWAK